MYIKLNVHNPNNRLFNDDTILGMLILYSLAILYAQGFQNALAMLSLNASKT